MPFLEGILRINPWRMHTSVMTPTWSDEPFYTCWSLSNRNNVGVIAYCMLLNTQSDSWFLPGTYNKLTRAREPPQQPQLSQCFTPFTFHECQHRRRRSELKDESVIPPSVAQENSWCSRVCQSSPLISFLPPSLS